MRGNHRQRGRTGSRSGSIPACAGEPSQTLTIVEQFRVYPRVCGGTPGGLTNPHWGHGLSPRVRGNRELNADLLRRIGSIPACAGEPTAAQSTFSAAEVYPRVCGGTQTRSFSISIERGLSPRVRGNLGCRGTGVLQSRSIPACAGEPRAACAPRLSNRVYPRVCGGTDLPDPLGAGYEGLSPRVRGNRRCRMRPLIILGSIPACAGEPPRGRVV